jgi:glycosyltransferase involved in cell wall biosynthesis
MAEKLRATENVFSRVSVIIPARNEAATIVRTLDAVQAQARPGLEVEVVVVDDESIDDTVAVARAAGAIVLSTGKGGNPGAARNRGAAVASGDPIIFLDADCVPAPGWLNALLDAHAAGATIVGGSLELPPGLPFSARCDYYASAFHVHPRRAPEYVPNHTPANLSVRRDAFRATEGFTERGPVADGHEELAWQAELQRAGHKIRFEPAAMVYHYNRPGFANLMRRNYRWAYSTIESKATTGVARYPWLYRHPGLLTVASGPLAIAQLGYILGSWLRAGVIAEPILTLPGLLLSRVAYAAGSTVGGLRWLNRRPDELTDQRPRWR